MPSQTARVWVRRIGRLRRQHRDWGAKKLRAVLGRTFGGRGLPCPRTIARWVERLGLTHRRRVGPRKAGCRRHPLLTRARRANHVWTVDFKGWFRTGDGTRVEPLTVRDLFSRYGLVVQLLPDQRWRPTQAVFRRLFGAYGMPEVIRVDNGGPFASRGPAGLSRLSVWWLRLGIRVEFTRPGHPEDNGSHEQFHRELKRGTTRPPARTPQGQQYRSNGWLNGYNHIRPHEALGQGTPGQFFRKSGRRYPQQLPAVRYPKDWLVRQVRSNGEIRWQGRRRFVGEAFVGQPVALKRRCRGVWSVYFLHLQIGHLHAADIGAMRPMFYRHRWQARQKAKSVSHVLSSKC